jgi:glycyl-tRNA synthetase beta chain
MKDLLIEIGCEDLPARFVKPLQETLLQTVQKGLEEQGLLARLADCRAFATPRRIAVLFAGVADRAADRSIERKGPKLAAALKDGQPTPAGLGFAKTCGVEFAALAQEDGQLVFRTQQAGKAAVELIPELVDTAFKQMDAVVPKRMRWGSGSDTFVRPVQWLTVLFGDAIVPVERFGLRAGRLTYGHRFHAPEAIPLAAPADYEARLKSAKVWADFASRRDDIERQIKAEAANLGGTAKIDETLLDEVTALVEWPVVISGRIEEKFLALPPEVIVATVETNQRYFTVFDTAGKLLPSFITISNIESKDVAQVIGGNERVVRPRLSDALFFWEQDRKAGLSSLAGKLATTTYQKELGSLAGKVDRLHTLAIKALNGLAGAQLLSESAASSVNVAVSLCKLDLFSKTVYEFPELQGLAGGYLAAAQDELPAVATAIREHYLPTQSGGPIPSTIEGRIVALADKLDTLAGIFAIGQKPTASKDPYALRRAALGVLRILIEGRLPLDLATLLHSALAAQPDGKGIKKDAAVLADLTDFVFERLRGYYTEQQLPPEMFEAVKALGITVPTDFDARVQALRAFWSRPTAKSLAAAHKRIRNVLKQAGAADGAVDSARFEHDAERALLSTLEVYESAELAKDDYPGRLSLLADRLQAPVDAFFAAVMVMADDPAVRANRLALLRRLDAVCREVADISLLPG